MTGPANPGQGTGLWSAARLLVLAAAIGAGALLVWHLAQVLLLLFGSVLVAILLRSIAGPVARHTPIPDRLAVASAALLILVLLVGFALLLGAQIRAQGTALLERLPDLVRAVEDQVGADALGEWLDQQRGQGLAGADLVASLAGYTTRAITAAAKLVVMLAAGIYLALNPALYLNGILKLVPPSRQQMARYTVSALGQALKLWLVGQLAAMMVVGALVTLGLTVLEIPSALALGFMAGLFEFVPFVGPVASALPAVASGLTDSPRSALWVAGLYVLVQQAEGMLILPLLQQRTVSLPPVLTIFAVLSFGVLFGPLGLILATPLAVVCLVLVKKLWMCEVLHEKVSVPGEEA
ncbi:AI-2E family transporter [Rubellimicrobium arenae]|uniref:AI-2E family transporter n=1 Tax=Rubellimicrobium arenae TaxID=2817372 RepID=UPI001B315E15|nr:AI-2E family transporter [Rubellimicrobium arenae]